jgi:hypothetical protein
MKRTGESHFGENQQIQIHGTCPCNDPFGSLEVVGHVPQLGVELTQIIVLSVPDRLKTADRKTWKDAECRGIGYKHRALRTCKQAILMAAVQVCCCKFAATGWIRMA